MFTSESSSCISSRGEYFFPVKRGRDSQAELPGLVVRRGCPSLGPAARRGLRGAGPASGILRRVRLDGFDYIGEPTPYNTDMTNLLNFSDPEKRPQMKKQLDDLGG